jgi:hypothetical protein
MPKKDHPGSQEPGWSVVISTSAISMKPVVRAHTEWILADQSATTTSCSKTCKSKKRKCAGRRNGLTLKDVVHVT